MVVQNRPPTRMHWWWSHSIPVIGYPMEAYLDAARRIDYPLSLLNLTNSRQIQSALQRLAPAEERSCLQRASAHGALLSSPSHSSLELLAAICAVADRCGKPARWPASSTRRHTIGGWARSGHSPREPLACSQGLVCNDARTDTSMMQDCLQHKRGQLIAS